MSSASTQSKVGRWLLVVAAVVIAATVAAAVMVMGTPPEQRLTRLDQRRVQDLQRIVQAVNHHARIHGELPEDLAALASQPGATLPTLDPMDGSAYEYAVTGQWTWRVCAHFSSSTADRRDLSLGQADTWAHGAGRHCFEQRVPEDSRPDGDADPAPAPVNRDPSGDPMRSP